MTNPIKATRATITLGDIKLDVFQLPDGSYRYGYEFLASLIDRDKSVLSDKKSPFHILKLLKSGGTMSEHNQKVKVDAISQTYNYNTLSEVDLIECLDTIDDLGFKIAKKLMKACTLEALERRADAAFGTQRLEEEHNAKMVERINGKVDRLTFTDAIGLWLIDPRNDPSENTKRFIYSNCSDCLNLIVLGFKSRKAKEILGVAEDSLLRDALPVQCLREIAAVERLACILVMEDNMHPLDAVKQASISVRARRVDF